MSGFRWCQPREMSTEELREAVRDLRTAADVGDRDEVRNCRKALREVNAELRSRGKSARCPRRSPRPPRGSLS